MNITQSNVLSNELPTNFDIPNTVEGIRDFLNKRERLTASVVNAKENGKYELQELQTAQQWFTATTSGALKSNAVFRLTFDLVALNNNVPIPVGATTLTLAPNSAPPLLPSSINIPNSISPVHGFGAANNGTNFYFINDPNLYIRTNVWSTATQQIIIQNNTGATLTYAVWVLEYMKF